MSTNNPHQTNFGVLPYTQLIKTEMVDKIQGIPAEHKPKIQSAVALAWQTLQSKHPDTPEHKTAISKLQNLGNHVRSAVKAFHDRQAAAAANGGSQPGQPTSQPSAQTSQAAQQARIQQAQQAGQQVPTTGPTQQNQSNTQAQIQAQQARLQAQAQAQANAQALGQSSNPQSQNSQRSVPQQGQGQGGQNPAQPGQQIGGTNNVVVPQASAQIRVHVESFPFTNPPTHPKGTEAGDRWLNATRAQYTSLLVYLEKATQIRQSKTAAIEALKNNNQPIPPQLVEELKGATAQYQKFKTQLDVFRKNQAVLKAGLEQQQKKAQEASQEGANNNITNTTTTNNNTSAAQGTSTNMTTIPHKPFTLQQPPQGNGAANAGNASAANQPNISQASNAANNSAPSTKPNTIQGSGNAASPIQGQPPTQGQFPTQQQIQGQQQQNQNQQTQFARHPGMAPNQNQNPQRPPLNTQPGQQGQTGPATSQSHMDAKPLTHGDAIQQARSHSEYRPTTSSVATTAPLGGSGPPNSQSNSMSQSQNRFPLSKTLPQSVLNPPQPVMIAQPRPTMASGGATSQPIIAKQPTFTLEGEGSSHVLSKKKLHELVRQVTGGAETLTPEVEEIMLEAADEFTDSLITAACRLAKLRPDATLEIRDLQMVLERNYNIRIPGYSQDETRVTRRVNPSPAWSQKIGAINTAKVMGSTKPDP